MTDSEYYDHQYYAYEIVDNQILQRNPLTGEATVVYSDDIIEKYKMGGPYHIDKAKNVYVGDVFVMAGQSNMRGHGYLFNPYTNESCIEEPELGIHLYNSREKWTLAAEPLHQLVTSPRSVHHTLPDPTVRDPGILSYRGASLGLSFAKEFRAVHDKAPVGLVACAHGGTTLNDWKRPEDPRSQENADSTLYGAMLDKIDTIGPITGILWYQGESDTEKDEDANTYEARFRNWINDVRMDIGYEQLPIFAVQIGPHAIDKHTMKANWRKVQQAQYNLINTMERVFVTASIGCPLDDRVHLSALGLRVVGLRLAFEAHLALRQGLQLEKPVEYATYRKAISPHLSNKIAPCVVLRLSINIVNFFFEEVTAGFALECSDESVALLSATFMKDGNSRAMQLLISHKPKGTLYVTYGMDYPVSCVASMPQRPYSYQCPAFRIEVKEEEEERR